MYCIAEITLYPLTRNYEPPILDFIGRLREHSELDVSIGTTSTVIRGEYDLVMEVLTREMKKSMDGPLRMSFVVKILNTER